MDAARQVLQQGRNAGLKGDKVEVLNSRLVTRSDDITKVLNEFINLYNQGKFHEVVTRSKLLSDTFSTNHLFYNTLGASYAHLGKSDEAISNYKKAIQLKPLCRSV